MADAAAAGLANPEPDCRLRPRVLQVAATLSTRPVSVAPRMPATPPATFLLLTLIMCFILLI